MVYYTHLGGSICFPSEFLTMYLRPKQPNGQSDFHYLFFTTGLGHSQWVYPELWQLWFFFYVSWHLKLPQTSGVMNGNSFRTQDCPQIPADKPSSVRLLRAICHHMTCQLSSSSVSIHLSLFLASGLLGGLCYFAS